MMNKGEKNKERNSSKMHTTRTINARRNMMSSLLLQLFTAISGLVIPRIIIPTYGSDVNGLLVSITQFISYISLFEAGVGSVFRASLYKPLHQNDIKEVSGIINAQKRFYRKIGAIFIAYILVLCIVYPYINQVDMNRSSVIALILLLSLGTFIEYFISLPYQSLIIADQMVRLVNLSAIIVIIANIVVTAVLVKIGASIITLKIYTSIIVTIRPIIYIIYVKRHYTIDSTAKPNNSALSQRWNGLVHHLSYYIHRNTDIALLTIFVSASTVSVYSIYLAVVTGIQKIVTSISSGLSASVGNMIADGDKNVIDKTVNQFEFVQITITTILYTITALMLMPFIKLYTENMTDANYIQPVFGYLLIVAEAVYCIRCIYSTITMSGNKFKETQPGAVLECIINLGVSLVFVMILHTEEQKLIAIASGTLFGMFARLFYEVFYLSKDLLNRPVIKSIKVILSNIVASVLSILACQALIRFDCCSVQEWILVSIESTFVVVIITTLISYFLHKKIMLEIWYKLCKK